MACSESLEDAIIRSDIVSKAIRNLRSRDREVLLDLLYEEQTDLGRKMKLSQSRIFQIKERALRGCRHQVIKLGLSRKDILPHLS